MVYPPLSLFTVFSTTDSGEKLFEVLKEFWLGVVWTSRVDELFTGDALCIRIELSTVRISVRRRIGVLVAS